MGKLGWVTAIGKLLLFFAERILGSLELPRAIHNKETW